MKPVELAVAVEVDERVLAGLPTPGGDARIAKCQVAGRRLIDPPLAAAVAVGHLQVELTVFVDVAGLRMAPRPDSSATGRKPGAGGRAAGGGAAAGAAAA